MKIYYPFYYLFYRLYRFNEVLFTKTTGDNWPLIGAVSSFQILNILGFIFIYESYTNHKILITDASINYIIPFSILGINAFIFLWKRRDKKIISMFENETVKQKNISLLITWVYIIFTYVFIIFTFNLD